MPPRAPRRTSVVGAVALLVLGPLLLVASTPVPSTPGARTRGLRVSLSPAATSGVPVLAPGLSVPLDLHVANPYGVGVEVTDLHVRVRSVSPAAVPGCAAGDFVASDAAPPALVLPARGSSTLSSAGVPVSRWPRVGMPASATGREACRGLEISLDFVASGRFR